MTRYEMIISLLCLVAGYIGVSWTLDHKGPVGPGKPTPGGPQPAGPEPAAGARSTGGEEPRREGA